MQLFLCDIRILQHLQAHIIEALERADTGGSDGYCLAIVSQQTLDGVATDGNVLRVHRMVADGLALDRSEGASADVQRDFLAFDATGVDVAQDAFGEVKTGCRSRNAAFNLRIDGLIGRLVALLCLAIQIRRNGQLTHHVDDFSERHIPRPFKLDELAGADFAFVRCGNGYLCTLNTNLTRQRNIFLRPRGRSVARNPFLLIANQTQPLTTADLLEHLFVVARHGGL